MRIQLIAGIALIGCSHDLATSADAPRVPAPARMTVSVAGLPISSTAQLVISGPNGYRQVVRAPVTLDTLPPGDYSVQAAATSVGADDYEPTTSTQSVLVAAGDTKQVQVAYQKVAVPASGGLPPHPRVWLTPARIAFVKQQAALNSIRWQRVKSAADAQLSAGPSGDPWSMPDLCLAYLVTNDARYAQEAGTLLTSFAVAGNNSQSGSAYPYRYDLPVVTKALDWCYNGLSVAQRQQAATWLMDHADWVWPESNPARVGGWAVADPGNNYYWGFMMTGPAALAAAEDDRGTGMISGAARPAYHRQLAVSHWLQAVVPFLASGDAGGAWQEGTGYDSNGRIAMFADGLTTSGIPTTDPVFNSILRWRFASTMPGGAYHMPIGDQARVSNGVSYVYDRIAVLNVMAVSDQSLSAQAQYWLGVLGQVPTYENSYGDLADELIRFDPNAASTGGFTTLPLDHLAPGAGLFTYRQSWTDPNATTWVFQAGPLQSHNAGAGNSLRIWKGSFWISADANIYSASGIEQASDKFNTLTVGGGGQLGYGGSQLVGTPQVSPSLVVARGQASDAYRNRDVSPVTDYLRTVSYLPELDAFVIVDRATAANPAQTKVWRWHTQGTPQVSGNTFVASNPGGDARCTGRVLLPGDAALGVETIALGSGNAISSHAVTVTLPTPRATDVVVTVFQCGQDTTVPIVTTNPTATLVTIGLRRVTVPADATQPVTFEAATILRDP